MQQIIHETKETLNGLKLSLLMTPLFSTGTLVLPLVSNNSVLVLFINTTTQTQKKLAVSLHLCYIHIENYTDTQLKVS